MVWWSASLPALDLLNMSMKVVGSPQEQSSYWPESWNWLWNDQWPQGVRSRVGNISSLQACLLWEYAAALMRVTLGDSWGLPVNQGSEGPEQSLEFPQRVWQQECLNGGWALGFSCDQLLENDAAQYLVNQRIVAGDQQYPSKVCCIHFRQITWCKALLCMMGACTVYYSLHLHNKIYLACKELCILSFQTILCEQLLILEWSGPLYRFYWSRYGKTHHN